MNFEDISLYSCKQSKCPSPPFSLIHTGHELLLLPSISDKGCSACAQFSLVLRNAMVAASAPACLVHTVPECGSGWPGQKARWALIKDRAGTPSRSLLRSSSAQCFVLWLEALHFQRKEDLETSRRRRSRL